MLGYWALCALAFNEISIFHEEPWGYGTAMYYSGVTFLTIGLAAGRS